MTYPRKKSCNNALIYCWFPLYAQTQKNLKKRWGEKINYHIIISLGFT